MTRLRAWNLLTLFLCLGLAAQAQMLPSPFGEDKAEAQEILLVGRWLDDGVSRLKLESAEGSSSLRKVDLQLGCETQEWAFSLRSQGDFQNGDHQLEVSTQREVNSRLKTFLEWEQHNQSSRVGGGLECSLFGPDRWKASHTMDLGSPVHSRAVTETSLAVTLSQAASVELGTVHSQVESKVRGGVSCSLSDGIDLGASLYAQKSELQETSQALHWQRPSWEGHLRWSW